MTDSPPETPDPLAAATEAMASRLGAVRWVAEFGTPRIYVDRDRWVETLRRARDEEGLRFFSWLSAIDWAKESAVGEGVADPDSLEERFEVVCRLSSVESADAMHFLAVVPKDDPVIDSIVPLFAGAAWHEREAHEMFGIDFRGHPYLAKLYLPDGFEGHPLRKDFPLLSREVKPWPGTVDVEDKPSLENVEAGGER
ncbi:MAG TPA: NADH-quinone oxidoreductase subunit C [Actinobacteria bacterium]|nr:NADH-quinone oxidoreductase subunit C [Actinomycetota bacterium]